MSKKDFDDNTKEINHQKKVRKSELSRNYRKKKVNEYDQTRKAKSVLTPHYSSFMTTGDQKEISDKLKKCYVSAIKH